MLLSQTPLKNCIITSILKFHSCPHCSKTLLVLLQLSNETTEKCYDFLLIHLFRAKLFHSQDCQLWHNQPHEFISIISCAEALLNLYMSWLLTTDIFQQFSQLKSAWNVYSILKFFELDLFWAAVTLREDCIFWAFFFSDEIICSQRLEFYNIDVTVHQYSQYSKTASTSVISWLKCLKLGCLSKKS